MVQTACKLPLHPPVYCQQPLICGHALKVPPTITCTNFNVIKNILFQKNTPPNVEEISLKGTIPEIANNLTKQQLSWKPDMVRNLENIMNECVQACDIVSRVPAVRALINSSLTFDMVIVEVFGSECFLPLGKRFKAPVVGFLSSVPPPWLNEQIGNPEATGYVPAYMTGFGQHMTLWERFANTISVIGAKILYKYKSQIPSQVCTILFLYQLFTYY
jgi:glucuronosyltransferase